MTPLTVGFDLDMTLIDSRPGVAASMQALSRRLGVRIDAEVVTGRLGPPLEQELAHWLPAADVPAGVETYREIYAELGPAGVTQLPGAADALAAVRRQGGRSVVVTAKRGDFAVACLAAAGLAPDAVVGNVWGAAKGPGLLSHGASVYVGDHPYDVAAARAAGATAVGVATGGTSAAALRAAGSDVVLADLTAFPAWLDGHLLPARLAALGDRLRSLGSVLVAFSGGADSAFLLAAAVRALGPAAVVAATALSPSLPGAELTRAAELAAALGVRHLTPGTEEMARAGYRDNAGDRCYFCKAELLDVLGPLAAELGIAAVATGTNADDAAAGFRPGIRAAAERGALTPLRDAGLTKAQVRAASRDWSLPTWDKPAAACLSSRVAYGVAITSASLARVDRAEVAIRSALAAAGLPVGNVRVRDLGGDRARVEVDPPLVPTVRQRPELLAGIDGFATVELDSRGFRSGSMNELLAEPARYR